MVTSLKVKPFYEVKGNELVLHMENHIGQAQAWVSAKRYIAMLAGGQGGKTVFGVQWLRREIELRGPGDYLVITATYPLLKLKLLPEFLKVFDDILKLGEFNKEDKTFYFNDRKTRVIFCTATNPEGLESATAKAAWLDEAGQDQFKREAWEAVQRRLAINKGRALFSTTVYNLGWLKQEIYDRWVAGDPDIEVVQFDSTTNPAFPLDEYERQKELLPAWKFDMFYRGRFTVPAGIVYDCFKPEECVVRPFPIDKDKFLIYVGHDFGSANPAALFYAQDTSTGLFYLWHEYAPGRGKSVAEHVEYFKNITEGMTVVRRAGGSHQEEEVRQAYSAHGWPIMESRVKTVEEQIQRVYSMHRLNKIMVFSDMKGYLDEKMRYSYMLGDDYNVMNDIKDRQFFHFMDAERYILSSLGYETPAAGRFKTISFMHLR